MAPTVSVVIPTYNCADYIEEVLARVFAQTYQDFEVLMVDGSTDGTPSRLRAFEGRMRVIRRPARGVAAARNEGMQQAQGRFVALLDGDDLWEPELLARQVAALEAHPEAVMSFTDLRKFGEIKPASPTRVAREDARFQEWIRLHQTHQWDVSAGRLHDVLLWGNVVPTSSVVLRRARAVEAGLFDEQFNIAEDYAYWLRLSLRFPVVYVAQPLVSYRVRQTGLSGSFADRAERFLTARIQVLEKHVHETGSWFSRTEWNVVRRRLATVRYRLGTVYLKRGEGAAAARHIGRAIQELKTVGLEFAEPDSSPAYRVRLLLKPYAAFLAGGLGLYKRS